MTGPEAQELLTSNLAVIERAVAFAARRQRLDADELAAIVKLKLVEDDYAVLRSYEQRCSFATFVSIVVQRTALDVRIHQWGKWHSSAEAKRLGALAVDLERLLRRDGRSLHEAVAILAPRHEGVTRQSLETIAAALPVRAPRPRDVDLEEAASVAAASRDDVEEPLLAGERRRESERVSALMAKLIAELPDEDRLFLQLRFEGGMTVAQIARAFRVEQKLLYRRIDRRMRDLRDELARSGVDEGVLDLVGRDEELLRFDFGNRQTRPSIAVDERATAEPGDPL